MLLTEHAHKLSLWYMLSLFLSCINSFLYVISFQPHITLCPLFGAIITACLTNIGDLGFSFCFVLFN